MDLLGELVARTEELEDRGLAVVAIATGEHGAEAALGVLDALDEEPPFEVLVDVGGARTADLEPTTSLLVDGEGRVLEAFPMRRGVPLSIDAVLERVDRLVE